MRFIRKKNFHEGEELLYVPKLHWIYTVRHMVAALPFFILVLILWGAAESIMVSIGLGFDGAIIFKAVIKYALFVAILIVLLMFVYRIFFYLYTEYGVTNRRLIIKKGIIRISIAEIPIDRIESIYCFQGLLGRIFHYGEICIPGIGGTMPVFRMVARPFALRRKIVEIIEKNKVITVIHGELPRAQPVVKPEKVVEKEPMYRYGTFVRVIPGK
jgi:membrane protein YdbS with pleckstrin-like domain